MLPLRYINIEKLKNGSTNNHTHHWNVSGCINTRGGIYLAV